MKSTLLWCLAALGALAAWSMTFIVGPSEVAVVSRFGAPRRVVDDAGLHVKWPAPFDTVTLVDQRVHVLDPSPGEYLTRDPKNVIIDAFLVWRVSNPQRYLVRFPSREAAELGLTDILRSSLGIVVNVGPFDDLVSIGERDRSLDDIVRELTAEVARRVAADELGIEVQLAGIKRVNYPESNKNAVFNRMRDERRGEAETIRSLGQKEASDIQTLTATEVAEMMAAAELESAAIRGEARAEAARLESEAWDRDPEMAELLRASDVYKALPDTELVLPADHRLLRLFDPDALGGSGAAAAPRDEAGDE